MDFTVNPDGLDRVAQGITGLGQEAKSQAGSIQQPDALMMGMFVSPFLSAVLPALTNAFKDAVAGTGNGYEAVGGRLANTAKVYRDVEEDNLNLIGSILKEL